MNDFNGVQIFSATKAADRANLSEVITGWLRKHPSYQIVDKHVSQSSDNEFHCLTITFFYKQAW